jgi:hypothetical protein
LFRIIFRKLLFILNAWSNIFSFLITGDFSAAEPQGPDEYGDYFDHANMLACPSYLLIFLACAMLLWGF